MVGVPEKGVPREDGAPGAPLLVPPPSSMEILARAQCTIVPVPLLLDAVAAAGVFARGPGVLTVEAPVLKGRGLLEAMGLRAAEVGGVVGGAVEVEACGWAGCDGG